MAYQISELAQRTFDLYDAENYEEAFKLAKEGEEKGDAACINLLGIFYFSGKGEVVRPDKQKAMDYYLEAAKGNYPVAFSNVAYFYRTGVCGGKNLDKARQWYKKAIDAGYLKAKHLLGKLELETKNYTEAKKWLEESIADGYNYSKVTLARYYYGKEREDYDEEKAFSLFMSAAEDGVAEAMTFIGESYRHGENGLEKDLDLAYDWLLKAAEKGNRDAKRELSMGMSWWAIMHGDSEGFEWIKKTAERGYPAGIKNLADCYERGKEVEADYEKALELYEKAAELGDESANQVIDLIKTRGLSDDYQEIPRGEAWAVYQREYAKRGNADLQYITGYRYAYGIGFERDEAEAMKWYKMSVEGGSTRALYNLGWYYAYGVGVEKDENVAIEYWKKAAAAGDENAKESLKLRGIE